MAMLTLELPVHEKQRAFNLRRWAELLADPELARIEGRIETDRYGHVVMSPPPAPRHGTFQAEIAYLLRSRMPKGRVVTECPISTADGVKAADVAWASLECLTELGEKVCFPAAPEICVEVISPSNMGAEIQEKAKLYFDAGAREVWLCAPDGGMSFLGPTAMQGSRLCPEFPKQIQLR
jgi:Uma2 family endonuclease